MKDLTHNVAVTVWDMHQQWMNINTNNISKMPNNIFGKYVYVTVEYLLHSVSFFQVSLHLGMGYGKWHPRQTKCMYVKWCFMSKPLHNSGSVCQQQTTYNRQTQTYMLNKNKLKRKLKQRIKTMCCFWIENVSSEETPVW